mmetsp:Transcript_16345/g.27647  ORF Transcript_16345/g.27647 Transcript_16345/m.27647 type:complete len:192 (-) Transcript_16345:572-1147(-)
MSTCNCMFSSGYDANSTDLYYQSQHSLPVDRAREYEFFYDSISINGMEVEEMPFQGIIYSHYFFEDTVILSMGVVQASVGYQFVKNSLISQLIFAFTPDFKWGTMNQFDSFRFYIDIEKLEWTVDQTPDAVAFDYKRRSINLDKVEFSTGTKFDVVPPATMEFFLQMASRNLTGLQPIEMDDGITLYRAQC